MSNQIVAAFFEGRLKTWADAQVPPVPVAYENVAFTKPDDGTPWLESFLIPNLTMNNEVTGRRKTHLGLFQVNVWVPKGEGMGRGRALSNSIINLFPLLPKVGAVSVEETPSATRPLDGDSNWVIVPVLIKYRYESN